MAIQVTIEGLAELQAAAARAGTGLDEDIAAALGEVAAIVAKRAQVNAPKRTGRMARSVAAATGGASAEVAVSARARDGYPYPQRIERQQPWFAPAVAQEAPRIEQRMERLLDDIGRRWGGG